MKVVIAGATGLIGTALTETLRARGDTVIRLVRRLPSGGADGNVPNDVHWDPTAGTVPAGTLHGAGAVVNLAGAGIGDHRWTATYKHTLRSSRIDTTRLLAEAVAEAAVQVFLSGSAVGIYGNRGDELLTESSPIGTGFLAELCRDWEAATSAARQARVVHLRTGVVLARHGGALRKQVPLFKVGLGGKMGDGRQWLSWITLDDHVSAMLHLLTADREGPVDLTAPEPVTNAAFTRLLAATLRRPAVLPIPKIGPRLILGRDLADNLLFDGQRVMPGVLRDDGFSWQQPALDGALRAVLKAA